MRKIFNSQIAIAAVISTLCVLASCGYHAPPPRKPSGASAAIVPILDRIRGSWISYDYEYSLSKTHSLIRSSAFLDGIFSFVINPANASSDTISITALVKGQPEELWIALGRRDSMGRYNAGQHNDAALVDKLIKARIDSPYISLFTTSDSTRYMLYDEVYSGRAADYILKHYTTTTLFMGDYHTVDSTLIFHSSHISFDRARMGRITGSPAYDSFDINIDVLSQRDTMDYIELYDTRGVSESHSYTYAIKGDRINIYPLQSPDPCRLVRYTAATDSSLH